MIREFLFTVLILLVCCSWESSTSSYFIFVIASQQVPLVLTSTSAAGGEQAPVCFPKLSMPNPETQERSLYTMSSYVNFSIPGYPTNYVKQCPDQYASNGLGFMMNSEKVPGEHGFGDGASGSSASEDSGDGITSLSYTTYGKYERISPAVWSDHTRCLPSTLGRGFFWSQGGVYRMIHPY